MNKKMKTAAAAAIAALLYGGGSLFDQESRIGVLEEMHGINSADPDGKTGQVENPKEEQAEKSPENVPEGISNPEAPEGPEEVPEASDGEESMNSEGLEE